MNKDKSLVNEYWRDEKLWHAIKMWWPNRKENTVRDFIRKCVSLLKNKRVK